MTEATETDTPVSMHVKIDPSLKARLEEAAAERLLGTSRLVELALNEFLERLIPIDELALTRPGAAVAASPPAGPTHREPSDA